MLTWWQFLLAALVGAFVGLLAGFPYRKTESKKNSKLVVNLILGTAGGLLGAFLLWVINNLFNNQVIALLLMSVAGAIIMIWLLSRVKSADKE